LRNYKRGRKTETDYHREAEREGDRHTETKETEKKRKRINDVIPDKWGQAIIRIFNSNCIGITSRVTINTRNFLKYFKMKISIQFGKFSKLFSSL